MDLNCLSPKGSGFGSRLLSDHAVSGVTEMTKFQFKNCLLSTFDFKSRFFGLGSTLNFFTRFILLQIQFHSSFQFQFNFTSKLRRVVKFLGLGCLQAMQLLGFWVSTAFRPCSFKGFWSRLLSDHAASGFLGLDCFQTLQFLGFLVSAAFRPCSF